MLKKVVTLRNYRLFESMNILDLTKILALRSYISIIQYCFPLNMTIIHKLKELKGNKKIT